jgi:poly[(R)-3-hydroxyalkanoate] polymerase subunit PhaC
VTTAFEHFESLWRGIGRQITEAAAQVNAQRQGSPGCSSAEVVWREDKAVLYRYLPLPAVKRAGARPLLICYALVNRPDVLDLEPERSLVRALLAAGLEVYLLDWGRPDPSDRGLELVDYIERYLGGGIQHLLEAHRIRSINLLGVCQGGTFSLCYCALHPQRVSRLVTMVTPVDFQTPQDLLSKWARQLDTDAIAQAGNLSGAVLTGLFLALRPFRLMQQKYVDLLESYTDPAALATFCRMERWIFDSPDQAASALAQFVRWFYQENRLVGRTLQLGRSRVDLRNIRHPVLNIYADRDHIVPAAASAALRQHLRSRDYSEMRVDTGHIGMYISRHCQQSVASRIADWLLKGG